MLLAKTRLGGLATATDDYGIALIATIAHEFGHVAHFRRGLRTKLLEGQRYGMTLRSLKTARHPR